MSSPRSSFRKIATELAAEQLIGIGVDVKPDGRKALRNFFDSGEQRDPEGVWSALETTVAVIRDTAKELGVTELTSLTFPRIKDKICPLYPWC